MDIPPKLERFQFEQRHLDVNEYYLFHGTKDDAVSNIVKKGFNPSYTDPKSMYGQGIYFAEDFTKADQYTDETFRRDPQGTELTVLLCRVLLGNFYLCPKSHAEKWTRPPCTKCVLPTGNCRCDWGNRYDSVLGDGRGMLFREFVVFEGDQCFPEYIIKYTRTGGPRMGRERV